MAPTIRIALSRRTPQAAIIVARIMNALYVIVSVDSSCVAPLSCSQMTASAASPGASFSAASAHFESERSMSSTAIEPS